MSKFTLIEKHAPNASQKPKRSHELERSQTAPTNRQHQEMLTMSPSAHDRQKRAALGGSLFDKDHIQAAVSELTEEWNLAEMF
jgi:hypothetical protein